MNTTIIRLPAVAGMFYPEEAAELRAEVESYIPVNTFALTPKALIAPHAGYVYSGPVAGSAYATLDKARTTIKQVVILGPTHRVGFRGIATSTATAFRTPLGDVPVDCAANRVIENLPGIIPLDRAHRDEHGIEVHLPFLQETIDSFSIVPLVVGDADAADITMILETLWGGEETLILISSDLSHYLAYNDAVKMDRATSEAISQLAPELIGPDQACGRLPIQGLLIAARNHQLKAHVLDLRNSGDTAGDRSRVVGYGAYAFTT